MRHGITLRRTDGTREPLDTDPDRAAVTLNAVAGAKPASWARSRLARVAPSLRQGLRIGSWLLLGQMSVAMAQFGFTVIRAHSISINQFGQWAFAAALVSFFGVIADFGITFVVVRELSSGARPDKQYLRSVAGVSLAVALLMNLLVAAVLLIARPGSTALLVAAMYGAQLVVTGYVAVFVAYNRSRHVTVFEFAGRLTQAVVLLGGATLVVASGGGVREFAAVALLAVLLAAVPIVAGASRRIGLLVPAIDIARALKLISTAWPIGAGLASTAVCFYFDSMLMGLLGQSRGVALYSAAYTLVFAATLPISVLQSAFTPVLARAAARNARDFDDAARGFIGLSALAGIAVWLAAPVAPTMLLTPLFGSDFADGAAALRLLFFAGGVMFLSSAFATCLLALGAQRAYLRMMLPAAALNIVLNLVLIPMYSVHGAAVATLLAEVGACLLLGLRLRIVLREQSAHAAVAVT